MTELLTRITGDNGEGPRTALALHDALRETFADLPPNVVAAYDGGHGHSEVFAAGRLDGKIIAVGMYAGRASMGPFMSTMDASGKDWALMRGLYVPTHQQPGDTKTYDFEGFYSNDSVDTLRRLGNIVHSATFEAETTAAYLAQRQAPGGKWLGVVRAPYFGRPQSGEARTLLGTLRWMIGSRTISTDD